MRGLTLVRAPAWLLIRPRPDLDLLASDQRNTVNRAFAPASAKAAAACLLFMVAVRIRGIVSPGVS